MDELHHDQPDRHRFGYALLEPPTPSTITPLVTQTGSAGVSEAPARADHTHSITAVTIPAIATAAPSIITPYTTQTAAAGSSVKYAKEDHVHGITGMVSGSLYYDFKSAYSSTDVVGNGNWQILDAEAGVVTIANPSSSTIVVKMLIQGIIYPQASVAADQAVAMMLLWNYTLDGSTPSAPVSAIGYWDTIYCNNGFNGSFKIHDFYVIGVGAGQTLKMKFKMQFYAGGNVTIVDHSVVAMAWC